MPRKKLLKDKSQILDEAERLIETEGIQAVSMRRLSKEMGVSDKTLYNYILNADAIMRELLIRSSSGLYEGIYARMGELIAGGMDASMAYAKAYGLSMYDFAQEHKDICAYLMGPGREKFHKDAELRPLYEPFGDMLLSLGNSEKAGRLEKLFMLYEGSVQSLVHCHISGIRRLEREEYTEMIDLLLELLFK